MSDLAKKPVITRRSGLLMLAAVCCSSASLADTTLTFSSEGDSLPQTIAIGSGKLRIDSAGESSWMLYDLSQNAMYMVDDAEQQYYRIDQSQIEQLGQTLGDLTSQLDSALANLPPEQRAAAKAMMKDMMPANKDKSDAPMIDVRATGKSDKVADIACSVHETWVADQRKNEVCVADSDALNLSREDERTMQGMADLMQELVDEVQKSVGDLLPENIAGDGLAQLMANGMPVRVHDYENGSSAELSAVSHDDIAASRLSVPEGYQAQSMDMGQ
ncbi:MAG: hypothetical protein Tsb0027_17000 [Wenzhouxiangellaceae bacterium]